MCLGKSIFLAAGILLYLCVPGLAQGSPGFVEGAALCANYPNPVCDDTVPRNPLSLNQAFMNKMDFGGPISGTALQLLNQTSPPIVDLTTVRPTNGLYASGGGARFSICPDLFGSTTPCPSGPLYTAFYLKASSIQDASIAEYMMVLDCRLNSGSSGTAVSLSNNKVCLAATSVTGPNSGGSTWVQANNLVLDPADLGGFKVTQEVDLTNNGADCAVGSRFCTHLYLSGNVGRNPVTAFITVAATGGSSTSLTSPNAHFGILLNGASGYLADNADIDNSGRAPIGICNGCLVPSQHGLAAIQDNSTAPYGLFMNGTYSVTPIHAILPTTASTGGLYVCVDSNGTFYRKSACP